MSDLTSAVSRASAGSLEFSQPFKVKSLESFLFKQKKSSLILAVDKNTEKYQLNIEINQLKNKLDNEIISKKINKFYLIIFLF